MRKTLLLFLIFLAGTYGVRAQQTPAEVRALANQALAQGDYGVAAQYLSQLIDWYGNETDPQIVTMMGDIYYSLGLSYLFMGEFAQAEEPFKEYPDAENYDDASLLLGQLYAQREDWPRVIEVLEEALNTRPQHSHIVECMFILGYACFMEERFADTVTWLTDMNQRFPNSDRFYDGLYWTGMALMFDREYELALPFFGLVVDEYPGGVYEEDASFRYASCVYGLSRYEEAEDLLLAFNEKFPDSRLRGEGYVMLGDIAGAHGALPLAIERFKKVIEYEEHVHIEFYNYASFRAGEMMNDLEQFDQMVAHFQDYMARDREDSNMPQAIYWIGHAYWQQDLQAMTLEFFRNAIIKYGADRMSLGIDLIMEQWIGKARSAELPVRQQAWKDLRDLHTHAMDQRILPLAFRLEWMLIYDPVADEREQEARKRRLLNERILPHAGIGVLDFVLFEAHQRGDQELALKTAYLIVETFPGTDTAIQARLMLARHALDQDELDLALEHVAIIRDVFPGSEEAAHAALLMGRIYREREQYDEADQAYQDVLGAREWRKFWPQALYERGENARDMKDYARAAAFFERIYLLYTAHASYTAKAYLARAECLVELNRLNGAQEVLNELLAHPDLTEEPAREAGRKLAETLKGSSI